MKNYCEFRQTSHTLQTKHHKQHFNGQLLGHNSELCLPIQVEASNSL